MRERVHVWLGGDHKGKGKRTYQGKVLEEKKRKGTHKLGQTRQEKGNHLVGEKLLLSGWNLNREKTIPREE